MTKEELKYRLVEPRKDSITQFKPFYQITPEELQQLILDKNTKKTEEICKLISQKFDDWVFNIETQSGEKLMVVNSSDFSDIIAEIEDELLDKKL